jgi:tRNA threonylcarbamoyl adenosine modification protein YjeE
MDLGLNPVVQETITLDLPDLAATHALAARLAALLQGGDLIALHGDLGAGKTEFARALIRTRICSPIEVQSPTFTIVQEYLLQGLTIRHIDLYRISDADDLVELGLDEAPPEGEAWLVEWPERGEGRLGGARLDILLEDGASPDARIARLTGDDDWTLRLSKIAHD